MGLNSVAKALGEILSKGASKSASFAKSVVKPSVEGLDAPAVVGAEDVVAIGTTTEAIGKQRLSAKREKVKVDIESGVSEKEAERLSIGKEYDDRLKTAIDDAVNKSLDSKVMSVFKNINTSMESPNARQYLNDVLTELKYKSPLTEEQLTQRMIDPKDLVGQVFSAYPAEKDAAKALRQALHYPMKQQELSYREGQLTKFLEPIIGKEKIDGILNGKEERMVRLQKLYDYGLAAQDRLNAMMKVERDTLWKDADEGMMNFESTLAKAYDSLSESGLTMPAEGLRTMFRHHTVGKGVSEKLVNMAHEWTSALELYGKKSKGLDVAMRMYMEIAQPRQMSRFNGVGQPIAIDAMALKAVGDKYGIALDAEHIEFLNRGRTLLRLMAREQNKQGNLRQFVDDIPFLSIFDIDGKAPQFMNEVYGRFDYGNNYWHLVPTKEYKAKALEGDNEYRHILESTKDPFLEGPQTTYFLRKKLADAKSFMKDEDRLAPADEMRQLVNQWRGHMRGGIQRNLMQETKAMVLLPSSGNIDDQPIMKTIKNIENFSEYITTVHKPLEGTAAVLNEAMNYVTTMILARPKMAGLNPLQGIVSGSTELGFVNMIAQTLSAGIKMPYYTLKNLGNVRKAWQDAASGFSDPQKRDVIMRLVASSSENRKMLDEELVSLTSKVSQGFLNLLTIPFDMGDRVARTATMSGAYDAALKAITKRNKAMSAKGADVEAINNQFILDSGVASWHKLHRENFLSAVYSGNEKQALYEYAKYATDAANFVYTKDAAPKVLAWARAQHPVAGWMTTFASYPMHYMQVVKAAFRAAEAGDGRPLAKLTAFSAAWIMAFKAVQGIDDDQDEETLAKWMGIHPKEFAKYAVNKGPVMNLTGLLDLPSRPIGGVAESISSVSNYALFKTFGVMNDQMNDWFDHDELDSLDWQESFATRKFKQSFPSRFVESLEDLYKKQMEAYRR